MTGNPEPFAWLHDAYAQEQMKPNKAEMHGLRKTFLACTVLCYSLPRMSGNPSQNVPGTFHPGPPSQTLAFEDTNWTRRIYGRTPLDPKLQRSLNKWNVRSIMPRLASGSDMTYSVDPSRFHVTSYFVRRLTLLGPTLRLLVNLLMKGHTTATTGS